MINELLRKYVGQKPKTYGDSFEERCYPASAVIAMLEEQAKELSNPVESNLIVLDKEKLIQKIQEHWDKHGGAESWEGIKMAKRVINNLSPIKGKE
jgi:hypothetical protein